MQSVVGALRVNLGLDSAQFMDGIKNAQSSLKKAGQSMRNIGAGLSVAITAPLAIAAKDMIQLAAQQEKAMALVTQGVKATGGAAGLSADELFRMASGLQEVSTFGDEEILQKVTGQLLTFTNIANDEFGRAQQAILDVSAVLGKDLQSTAIQVGKALNDPVRGLSALAESGIQFTDSQKDLIKSLAEAGDVAAAQGIILDELANQYGGQAAAQVDTFSGKTQQLANTWGDLKEEFGAILTEFLPPLIQGLRDAIKWVQSLDPATKEMAVKFGLLAAAVGPVLTVLGVLAISVAALSAPVLAVVAGVGALTAAAIAFAPEIRAATDAVIGFGKDALEYISGLPAEIAATFAALPAQMAEIGRNILSGLMAGLKEKYEDVKGSITGFAGGIVDSVKDTFGIKSPSKVFMEIGSDLMRGMQLGIEGTGEKVFEAVDRVTDNISRDIEGLFKSVLVDGQNFKSAFSNLLGNAGDRLLGDAVDSLFSLIPGFATGTSFAPGGLAMVGERGPELVNLPRGSQVYTAGQTASMMGGGGGVTINQSFSFAANGDETVKRIIQGEMPRIAESTKAAVVDAQRRGQFGGAF